MWSPQPGLVAERRVPPRQPQKSQPQKCKLSPDYPSKSQSISRLPQKGKLSRDYPQSVNYLPTTSHGVVEG